MNPVALLKKRSLDLHRLRVFLEKRLKRLRKTAATTPSVVVAEARPSVKTELSITADNVDEPVIVVGRSTRIFEPIDDDFDAKKTDLFDRCEREISELGRICRNLSQFANTTTTTTTASTTSRHLTREREHRRKELIRKLITTEAEERKVLVAIGLKGRELRHALLGGGTATMTRIGSSGEMLVR